jgi:hypothetical protein
MEALGGLSLVEIFAIDGGRDGPVGIRLFEGRGFGKCGQTGVFFERGLEGGVAHAGRGEGAGGVVDGDVTWMVRQGDKITQAKEHRLPSLAATMGEVERFARRKNRLEMLAVGFKAIGCSDDEDEPDVGSMREQGDGALKDRLARKVSEKFVAAKTRSGSGGRKQ